MADKESKAAAAAAAAAAAQQAGMVHAELDAKTKSLDEYRGRFDQQREENTQLKATLAAKEKDTFEVISFLRAENDSLKEQLATFESVVENAKEQVRVETARVNAERDARIKEMQTQFEKLEAARLDEMKTLRNELSLLQDFKERRSQLERELDDARQELTDMQAAHRDAFASLERKLFEEKQRLQKEAQQQVEEIKRHSEEEVVSRLDVSTKRILLQNRRLAEDLSLHVQETEDLTKQTGILEEENKSLRRDLSLNEQSVQEFAKHSYRQSKEIKDLNAKVRNLERSLTQIVRDFEKERDRVLAKNKQETDEFALENQGLRKVLQVKDKEHKRIKRLAQEILNQRTQVEQFFLESLEQVKEEIQHARQTKAQQQLDSVFLTQGESGGRSGKLPSIGGANDSSGVAGLAMGKGTRVDIHDLTWDDKERVLRLLFAKINQAQMPQPVELPPHSFDMSGRSSGQGSGRETPVAYEELRKTQMTPEQTTVSGIGSIANRPMME